MDSTQDSVNAFLRKLGPCRGTALAERRRDVKTGILDRTIEGIMLYIVDSEMFSQDLVFGPVTLVSDDKTAIVATRLKIR